MIIDFHTHTFPSRVAESIIERLSHTGNVPHYTNGSPEDLSASMKNACIDYSVNLPVMTRPDQVVHVHDGLLENLPYFEENRILTFGGLHPDFEGFEAELRRLKNCGIRGIKLHPAYQQTDLNDLRYLRIIDAISDAGMVMIVHAGLDIGYLFHNFASVPQILDVIEQVRPEKFVLAHMGGWQDWENVEKYLAGAPVFFDTAFSIGKMGDSPDGKIHYPYTENLSNDAFVRLVRAVGCDRVLFASDSPWADQKEYVHRLNAIPLLPEEKELIFCRNAQRLLNLS